MLLLCYVPIIIRLSSCVIFLSWPCYCPLSSSSVIILCYCPVIILLLYCTLIILLLSGYCQLLSSCYCPVLSSCNRPVMVLVWSYYHPDSVLFSSSCQFLPPLLLLFYYCLVVILLFKSCYSPFILLSLCVIVL